MIHVCVIVRMRVLRAKMEDELKKAEHLANKDPEQAMELLSAIGKYEISQYITWCLSFNWKIGHLWSAGRTK